MSNSTYRQYLRAKSEVETSIVNARSQHKQWQIATRENPTNLTKKEVEQIAKGFKNCLLTVKWDCEDLEELINSRDLKANSFNDNELGEARLFIEECREEIARFMHELEESEINSKIYNKHGITLQSQVGNIATMLPGNNSRYERLSDIDINEIHFDKTEISAAPNIVNNALYDHLEGPNSDNEASPKVFNGPQVFNNLTRPVTNVYMNPNDDEVILDMLETEYYNPPSGLQTKDSLNYTMRKLFDSTSKNKFLSTFVFLLTFPIIAIFFLIV